MSFMDGLKQQVKEGLDKAAKERFTFEVIGGENLLPKGMTNNYEMIDESKDYEDGVVSIKDNLYYYLGMHKEEKHKRSAGKAAAGAIIGGALTGGVGALVGGAIGGKRKDDSVFLMDLVDYDSKEEFSVQVKLPKSSTNKYLKIRPISRSKIKHP